jgi:hypothetical protein
MDGHDYFAALSCLLEDGVGLLIGTSDAKCVPRAGRAWGVRMDGKLLRVVISADDPNLIANLDQGSVAVTGADVRRLRSAQLKGRVVEVVEPDDADLAAADEHTAAFLTAILETDGTAYELTSRMLPRRTLTVVVEVEEGFDQTPGPAAGTPIPEPT